MSIVYHIASEADLQTALNAGIYEADSLRTEGFIHCSTKEQVIATANRLFKGRTSLVLLSIETDHITANVRYENLEGGTNLFPHVYGPLEIGSIIAVHAFAPGADGCFELPVALKAGDGAAGAGK